MVDLYFLLITSGCGGIGRRTRLRIWRRKAWGFDSLHPHQISCLEETRFVLKS